MLHFIGTGSAFNSELGNTGGFIKSEDGKTLFMIDCGETVYSRMNQCALLNNVKEIHILITHFHSDHVGSLGTLITYMYFIEPIGPKVTIYYPNLAELNSFLSLIGVKLSWYKTHELEYDPNIMYNRNKFPINGFGIVSIEPVPVLHVSYNHLKPIDHDKENKSFGYYITFINKQDRVNIYYSGDAKGIPTKVLNRLLNGQIDYFYQDISFIPTIDNPHMTIDELDKIIPKDKNIRNRIWCMHLDKYHNLNYIENLGFRVTKSILD